MLWQQPWRDWSNKCPGSLIYYIITRPGIQWVEKGGSNGLSQPAGLKEISYWCRDKLNANADNTETAVMCDNLNETMSKVSIHSTVPVVEQAHFGYIVLLHCGPFSKTLQLWWLILTLITDSKRKCDAHNMSGFVE